MLAFPHVAWLPVDATGQRLQWLWRVLGSLAIAFVVVGLAEPRGRESVTERVGRGAEIAILLDRSASMDQRIRRRINMNYQTQQSTKTKNELARDALAWLLRQRPENRFSLTLFHVSAMPVTRFTDDVGIVQAALDASAIGRGARETNVGLALRSAIAAFDGRPYTGSRALLLVSDGGAKLDEPTREAIREGLTRNQLSLYFIHVKSGINDQKLATVGTDTDSIAEEVTLHLFFRSIGVPYQVFEADDEASMNEAVAIIDAQVDAPLAVFERTPGRDLARPMFAAAAAVCLGLLAVALARIDRLH